MSASRLGQSPRIVVLLKAPHNFVCDLIALVFAEALTQSANNLARFLECKRRDYSVLKSPKGLGMRNP
jgi:hypothetical protein